MKKKWMRKAKDELEQSGLEACATFINDLPASPQEKLRAIKMWTEELFTMPLDQREKLYAGCQVEADGVS